MNLRNKLIKITENKVDWNICPGITEQNTHVFDTTARQAKLRPRQDERQRDDSRVLMRMPGIVYLLPVAVLAFSRRGILGRNPFNQNFRKFRSKSDRLGPTGKVSKKAVHLSRCTSFLGWTVPFDHSDPFSIPGPRCSVSSVYKMDENTHHCTFTDC